MFSIHTEECTATFIHADRHAHTPLVHTCCSVFSVFSFQFCSWNWSTQRNGTWTDITVANMSLLSPYLCFCLSLFLCVSTCLYVDTQPKKIRKPPGLPSSVRAYFCSPSQLTASSLSLLSLSLLHSLHTCHTHTDTLTRCYPHSAWAVLWQTGGKDPLLR